MKYRIMWDSSEGLSFHDGEFASVEEAVKAAIDANYGMKFIIVQVIEWEAKLKP